MNEKIAIAGGSGLVGQALLGMLKSQGRNAVALKRPFRSADLAGVTAIINLAGENLSAGRWSASRKKLILESRTGTLQTLMRLANETGNQARTLISASASGYYGTITSEQIFKEDDPPGNDFLAGVCREWEEAALAFGAQGTRVALVRIGVVLTDRGGALPKMTLPLKFGLSAPLGNGRQWVPWIRLEDLCRAFIHLLDQPGLSGPFNAVAPEPVTNRGLMQALARRHRKLFIPIGIPPFLLQLILGEMAVITLRGSRLSASRLQDSGFRFEYPGLSEGLKGLSI
ncbi:MAG: TIGR01777 family oxidoreductase [Bacteroidales bacterium]